MTDRLDIPWLYEPTGRDLEDALDEAWMASFRRGLEDFTNGHATLTKNQVEILTDIYREASKLLEGIH